MKYHVYVTHFRRGYYKSLRQENLNWVDFEDVLPISPRIKVV